MFSFLRTRDVSIFVLGLLVGAVTLLSLNRLWTAQVGDSVPVTSAGQTSAQESMKNRYEIPVPLIYDVKAGEQRTMSDVGGGKKMDFILTTSGDGIGATIGIGNLILPGAEYKGTVPIIGAIIRVVKKPWGIVTEADCREATQPGFVPSTVTLTVSETQCGRTTDGILFALAPVEMMNAKKAVLLVWGTAARAPSNGITAPAAVSAPASAAQTSSVAGQTSGLWKAPTPMGEVIGTIQTGKQGSIGVDMKNGKYVPPTDIFGTASAPYDVLLTVGGGRLSFTTLANTGADAKRGGLLVLISQQFKDVSYDLCNQITRAAASAYASKSPTAFSAFPPNVSMDLAQPNTACLLTNAGNVVKIGNPVVRTDGSIQLTIAASKSTADKAEAKLPVMESTSSAASSVPSVPASAPSSSAISASPQSSMASSAASTSTAASSSVAAAVLPQSATPGMLIFSGKTGLAFDLQTGKPVGAGDDISLAYSTTLVPRSDCRTVRSGFRYSTRCTTTYVPSTVLTMKALGYFTRIIPVPNKEYAKVTVQDCIDAVAKTKNVQPIVSFPGVQQSTVVCAVTLGSKGIIHAKIGGGTNLADPKTAIEQFTIWQ